MPVNMSTTDKATDACYAFADANRKFWHIAAHKEYDDPELLEAEKDLKAKANLLMQKLLGIVLEE